ncbi:MAG TPA: hypothetical protein VG347_17790 [Verrucomicrobiae bacterium]|nr:hypothetical protein [Verrucomicrobiae bacterium]
MKTALVSLGLMTFALLTAVPKAEAVPVTGVIGFSGTAQLNGATTGTSTEILAWSPNNVTGIASGSFAGLGGGAGCFCVAVVLQFRNAE